MSATIMSATPKKPSSSNPVTSTSASRRPSMNPHRSSSPIARGPPSSITPLTTNGIARSPSVRSPTGVTRPTRASVRRSYQATSNLNNGSAVNVSDDGSEDDARVENAALIDNLKRSLRNAELVSEDYQRQLLILQQRLDDVQREQGKMEDRLHESGQRVETLEMQKKDVLRQMKDMEKTYESERMAMIRDRDEQSSREVELKSTVQRLKETLAGREMRFNVDVERRTSRGRGHSRSSSVDTSGNFAPPLSVQRRDSSLHRNDSRSNSRVVMQKDTVIESLRRELTEVQNKLVEMENMRGHRIQEMERTLSEIRLTNARLMEDNESFQLLLGEKTLNGDFTKPEFVQGPSVATGISGLGSLAEELESAEGESENYRRLEIETKSLRDQNKALTLYIEKIISRVLQHDNFETILDTKADPASSAQTNSVADKHKDPPPPPAKDGEAPPSVLKRAMSAVAGRSRPTSQVFTPAPGVQPPWEGLARKPRPMTQVFTSAPEHVTTPNEDQTTAPSAPLVRAHMRTGSEKSEAGNAAIVVNQMYKGPEGPRSPALTPGGTTPRTSYFTPSALVGTTNNSSNGNLAIRAPSTSRTTSSSRVPSSSQTKPDRAGSSSNSAFSRDSGEGPSPPRNSAGNTNYTGAVMTQSKLRPLRLVQENQEMESVSVGRRADLISEDEMARKKVNRGSWMGWFNRGKDEGGAPRSISAGNIQH